LKDKARKAAKEKEKENARPATNDDATAKKRHPLAVKNFIPLAQFIAGRTKALLEFSSDFASRLDRAISL
jgi:hypothetical protein